MRKGFLLGVAVVFTIVGASQVFGQAASPGSRRARGAELRRLLRAVEGADEKPARTFRTPGRIKGPRYIFPKTPINIIPKRPPGAQLTISACPVR